MKGRERSKNNPREDKKSSSTRFSKKKGDGKFNSSNKDEKASKFGDRKFGSKTSNNEQSKFGRKKFNTQKRDDKPGSKFGDRNEQEYIPTKKYKSNSKKRVTDKTTKKGESDGTTRLNKYIANAGISSRREADVLIATGTVQVNGVVITEMGYKVKPGDKVVYAGEKIKNEKLVYLLLNKPKDHITTSKDPQNRRTVLQLVDKACKERIYPVGRLDRNTTGLLLLTNDGDLTKTLTHPKHGVKKIYHVVVDKALSKGDILQLQKGVKLEDGIVKADKASFIEGKSNRKEIGIELHSGKNRVIRRMMEALGYNVTKLDRVYFAGLTKKGIERGKFRFLSEKEVQYLKLQG